VHLTCIIKKNTKENEMSKFSDKFKELRKSRNLSQQQLADYLHTSKSSVNMYERGEREPGLEMLEAIADYFNSNGEAAFRDKESEIISALGAKNGKPKSQTKPYSITPRSNSRTRTSRNSSRSTGT